MIAHVVNLSITIWADEQRVRVKNSEVVRLVANSTLASSLLGRQSAVSLEEGLRTIVEWMKQQLRRYRPGVYVL